MTDRNNTSDISAHKIADMFDPLQLALDKLDFLPDDVQSLILKPEIRRGMLNCTRQWGKSTIAAIKAVHHAFTHDDASVIIVAPSERQSAELVRKCSRFLTKLDIKFKSDRSNRASLVLPNGARIIGFPASNDRIRGFSATLLIVDEAAHVSDDLYRTVRPFLAATNGTLWLMSTPNGKQGFFYDEWIAGQRGPASAGHNIGVNPNLPSGSATGAVTGDSEFVKISVPATDCPRISPKFLAEERSRMSEPQFAQEYLCQFGDTQSSLFCPEDIKALIRTDVEPLFPPPKPIAGLVRPPFSPPKPNIHPGWSHYFVGLDLGQVRDHTAIAVVEQKTFFTNLRDPVDFANLAFCRLRLRHIEKIPLRTSYVDAISRVLEITTATNQLPFQTDNWRHSTPTSLVVDATGVGRPVLDLLRKEQFRNSAVRAQIVGVNITSGHKAKFIDGFHQVPKRDLVTTFQIAVENQDLDISSSLPDQRSLLQELARFERRLTAYGNETFEAASGHDDLVMALLLAVYWAFKNPPPTCRNAEITRMVPRSAVNLTDLDLARIGLTPVLMHI